MFCYVMQEIKLFKKLLTVSLNTARHSGTIFKKRNRCKLSNTIHSDFNNWDIIEELSVAKNTTDEKFCGRNFLKIFSERRICKNVVETFSILKMN